jgi:hypothetical protein
VTGRCTPAIAAALAVLAPTVAPAQPARVPKIGVLTVDLRARHQRQGGEGDRCDDSTRDAASRRSRDRMNEVVE